MNDQGGFPDGDTYLVSCNKDLIIGNPINVSISGKDIPECYANDTNNFEINCRYYIFILLLLLLLYFYVKNYYLCSFVRIWYY
jgi:hypothetical protein